MTQPALIFDLDGTLVDSVYEHVVAWHIAFASAGVTLPAFEYHKRIGMTGAMLVSAVSDAFDLNLSQDAKKAIEKRQSDAYHQRIDDARAVPGVDLLWRTLATRNIPCAIATSADPDDAERLLKIAHVPEDTVVVTKRDETESKPSPEPFARAAEKLGVKLRDSIVIGDAVWDMLSSRRAGALGIGVLTGGYSREELVAAGAYRVYENVGEMSRRFAELGL
ncbi:MAG: HAD family hydrolase [Candidatus Eremiobacteraeota bacterium]|nr:HAD family hydrolase [Candidatus Eremiobacteraeota bacterium]